MFTKFSLSVALVGLSLFTLSACAPSRPQADWSGSPDIAKAALRFVANAGCGIPWPFDPVTSDFFEVAATWPTPGQWQYDIKYYGPTGPVTDRLNITRWSTATKAYSAPAQSYSAGQRCGVLFDVPQSKYSHRPYFVEDAKIKGREHQSAQNLTQFLSYFLCAVFIAALIPSWFGFAGGKSSWSIAALGASLVIITSYCIWYACIEEPWQTFQHAVAYQNWFDGLPRIGGALRPISADDFVFLLRGPPNPQATQISVFPFLIATVVLAAIWFGCVASAIVDGLYWLATDLPLEQVHRRALAEGRAPTVEELDAALFKSLAGKEAWQIDVLRRKAEAFIRRFGYPAVSP